MAEFAGLAYFAEVPAVIWDIQRIGPQHRPADAHQPGRYPGGLLPEPRRHAPRRCSSRPTRRSASSSAASAFDLAERLQTLVLVLSDLDLGMNVWISRSVRVSRAADGSRQGADSLEDLKALGDSWGRYKDVDGDGITYRTLPGTQHPGGRLLHPRHRPQRNAPRYSERPEDWEHNLNRLAPQVRDRAQPRARPRSSTRSPDARGSASSASAPTTRPSSRRATSWPRPASRRATCACVRCRSTRRCATSCTRYERVFVVENNHDGQLHQILLSEEPVCGGAADLSRPLQRHAAVGHVDRRTDPEGTVRCCDERYN